MGKHSIVVATLAALVSTSAFAADMPLKAPPAPVPIYDWNGFYFGGNVGYGGGPAPTDLNVPAIPDFDAVTIGPTSVFIPVQGASSSEPNRMNGITGILIFGCS